VALERAEPRAVAAVDGAGQAIGIAVAGVVNLLDLPAVVLGGCYPALLPWLRGAVEGELRTRVLTAGWVSPAVRAAARGVDATVVGAAGAVLRGILTEPAGYLDTNAA
jgi:predicted NBD/HSP70 family sugar kinase